MDRVLNLADVERFFTHLLEHKTFKVVLNSDKIT